MFYPLLVAGIARLLYMYLSHPYGLSVFGGPLCVMTSQICLQHRTEARLWGVVFCIFVLFLCVFPVFVAFGVCFVGFFAFVDFWLPALGRGEAPRPPRTFQNWNWLVFSLCFHDCCCCWFAIINGIMCYMKQCCLLFLLPFLFGKLKRTNFPMSIDNCTKVRKWKQRYWKIEGTYIQQTSNKSKRNRHIDKEQSRKYPGNSEQRNGSRARSITLLKHEVKLRMSEKTRKPQEEL